MGFAKDVVEVALDGVEKPVVAIAVADEEFWAAGAEVEAVGFDGGENCAETDEDGDGDGDDEEDEKDAVMQGGLARHLQCASGHGGKKSDAKGGFGIDEADGVLGVFDDFVEKLEAAGVFEDFNEWGQVGHGRECIKRRRGSFGALRMTTFF